MIAISLLLAFGAGAPYPENPPQGMTVIYGFGYDATYMAQPGITRTNAVVGWETDVWPAEELDLRYAESDPSNASDWNAWWGAATRFEGEPLPSDPGNGWNGYSYVIVGGLIPGRIYWFFLRARWGTNWSGNMDGYGAGAGFPVMTETDVDAPGAPQDFAGRPETATSIRATWIASGNDGGIGTASLYDLRCSDVAPGSDADEWWSSALAVSGVPFPAPAGIGQSTVIGNLTPGTRYWFALRAYDESSNVSPLSNIASVIATEPPRSERGSTSSGCGGSAFGFGLLLPALIAPVLRRRAR